MSARAKTPSTEPPTLPERPPVPPAKPRIKAISMKTPASDKIAVDEQLVAKPEPQIRRPKLRALSEVSLVDHPLDLGNFAPPADPAEIRAKRVRDIVLVASLSLIVASVIALIVWFAAR